MAGSSGKTCSAGPLRNQAKERLCAVCTVKRFVQREVLAREFNLQGGFPSTSEVAAACFKALILDKLDDGDVAKALKDFIKHAEQVPKTVSEDALPYLHSKAKDALSKDLLQLDGEYLFIDMWTVEHLREVNSHITEAEVQEGRQRLAQLYKAVNAQPKKYYAILYMDGDRMGRWLSGTHEGLARIGDTLHPDVRQNLESDSNWKVILDQKRLISPAVHTAISGALANFSLKLVRWVIEERHAGRVIYAGGDDVLALLPIDHVFSAARELRALFSGEVKANDASQKDDLRRVSWKVSFDNKNSASYIVFDGKPLLTMGPAATASIGVAIAHHLQPLDLALQAARRAEKAAKVKYGRNAFAVEVLKRSGEAMSVGVQFYRKAQDGVIDSIKLLQGFCKGLESRHISGRFPYFLQFSGEDLSNLVTAYKNRWDAMLQDHEKRGYAVKRLSMRAVSRVVVGLGAESVLETSIRLHRICGFPIIPGSALKGLARSYAELVDGKNESDPTFAHVFGQSPPNASAGKVVFFDAVPAEPASLRLDLDVMNPHYSQYYQGNNVPPADYLNPVPVFFLAIAPESEFLFAVACWDTRIPLEKQEKLAQQAQSWLQAGLQELGIGAKTAAGYGLWEPATPQEESEDLPKVATEKHKPVTPEPLEKATRTTEKFSPRWLITPGSPFEFGYS